MPTTVREIIEAAFQRSDFNDRALATDPELIGVLNRALRQVYTSAALVNPAYFGEVEEVGRVAQGWPRPLDAIMVNTIYMPDGERVAIVSHKERDVEIPPRVFEWGAYFATVGKPGDPENELLTVYYSRSHPHLNPVLSPGSQTLEPRWPEEHNPILISQLARHIAWKDGREGEVAMLDAEASGLMEGFTSYLLNQGSRLTGPAGRRARGA